MTATTEDLSKLQEYFTSPIYAKKLLEGYLAPRQGIKEPTYNLHGLTEYELNDFIDSWEECDDEQKKDLLKSFFIEFSGKEEAVIERYIDVFRKVFETNILNHERWVSPDLNSQVQSLLIRKHADNPINQSIIVKFAKNIDNKRINYPKNNDSRRYFNECLTEAERSQVVDMINQRDVSDLITILLDTGSKHNLSNLPQIFLNFVKSISLDSNLRKKDSEIFVADSESLAGFNLVSCDNEIKNAFITKITSFINYLEQKVAVINKDNIEKILLQPSDDENFKNEYIERCNEYIRLYYRTLRYSQKSPFFTEEIINYLKKSLQSLYENVCYIQQANQESGSKYKNAKILEELIKKLELGIVESAFNDRTISNRGLSRSNYYAIINKTIYAKPQLDMLALIRDCCTNQSGSKDSLIQIINDFINKYPKGINPKHIIPADINKSHDNLRNQIRSLSNFKVNEKTLAQTIDSILKESNLTAEERSILQEFIEKSFILYEVYKPNTHFNKINSSLLKVLDFSGSNLKQLDLSGSQVEELSLQNCKSLTSLFNIPTSLKKLNLFKSNIQTLDLNGSQLEELDIRDCLSLTSLSGLPTSLKNKKLDLSYTNIRTLDLSGSNLEELNLRHCPSLTSLFNIPTSLKKLDISESSIETLDLSGSQVEELSFRYCQRLTILSGIPNSLKNKSLDLKGTNIRTVDLSGSDAEELRIYDCQTLTSLSNIPTSLKRLELYNNNIKALNLTDSKVEHLVTYGCKSLTTLSALPASLKKINLVESGIQDLDLNGSQVEELSLWGCKSVTTLSALPTSLKKLELSKSSIQTLDLSGSNVEELKLKGCQNLTNLSGLPYSIKTIDLTNCDNLVATPELLEELANLENNGTLVIYPKHFNKEQGLDKAEARLENAITAYAKANPDTAKPTHIKTLMHRFLTESVGQRGSSTETRPKEAFLELLVTTEPFLKLLEENPNHLKWAEETASGFLAGCVNQPVAGWSEISAWTSVASADSLENKIEATKHLMVLDSLKGYVALQTPGQGLEVEAGNALFREVHKKLLENKNIESPWLGVPSSVAYEGGIRSWLTEARINAAFLQAKKVLSQERSELVNILCETNYKNNWMQIAFPDESAQIEADYARKEELLSDAIDKLKDNKAAEIEADLKTALPECFDEKGTLKLLSELEDLYVNLPKQKEIEISQTVRRLSETIEKEASAALENNEECKEGSVKEGEGKEAMFAARIEAKRGEITQGHTR